MVFGKLFKIKENMKKLLSALVVIMLMPFLKNVANASSFTDVPISHKNAEAIYYLQEKEILQGYSNGTFKPENKVNRAEFLKIILEGSNIKLDAINKINFKDVDKNAWYAPYVKKAEQEGFIEGYPDGTFKPENFINKAETLKIVGKVQDWEVLSKPLKAPFKDVPMLAWYAPYVEYAKNHDFLEEKGDFLQPEAFVSRAKISEIIYRTIIFTQNVEENNTENPKTDLSTNDLEPKEKTQTLNFIPVTAKTIGADFFDKIILSESFPNTFYEDEVYILKGTVTEGSYSTVFAFINKNSDNANYSADVQNNSFEIKIHFEETGNFKMGIIPGTQGSSKIVDISVLPRLPQKQGTTQVEAKIPSGLDVIFSDDKVTFYWNDNSDITKLLIAQGDKIRRYIFRQKTGSFSPEFKDFEEFSEWKTYFQVKTATLKSKSPIEIDSDWQKSDIKEFDAAIHQFSDIKKDKITHSKIPETLVIPQKIQFSGLAKEDLLQNAALILPSGEVETVELSGTEIEDYNGNGIIKKNSTYTFAYTPKETGTYILEINEKSGYAVLNTPVYIGGKIPLMPDFFDLEKTITLTQGEINIANSRNEILQMINDEREKMEIAPLILSDDLNSLAQVHTEDMIKNNFFGHINLSGQTPDNRRVAAGITTEVGENLAKAGSIKYAHEGLMRSATHRKNIIGKNWTRVGLGIKKDALGYYIITEEFSKEPITESDLQALETEIINHINSKREDGSELVIDPTLNQVAEIWSAKMVEQNFLGFSLADGTTLEKVINDYDIATQTQAFVSQSTNVEGIKTKIDEDTQIEDTSFKKAGLKLKVDSIGNLKFTLLYTH